MCEKQLQLVILMATILKTISDFLTVLKGSYNQQRRLSIGEDVSRPSTGSSSTIWQRVSTLLRDPKKAGLSRNIRTRLRIPLNLFLTALGKYLDFLMSVGTMEPRASSPSVSVPVDNEPNIDHEISIDKNTDHEISTI